MSYPTISTVAIMATTPSTSAAASTGLSTGEEIAAAVGGVAVLAGLVFWLARSGHHGAPPRANPARRSPMRPQSLLFPRDRYTLAGARRWATQHGYRSDRADVTNRYIHLTQHSPSRDRVIRTIRFGHTGILARVGRP